MAKRTLDKGKKQSFNAVSNAPKPPLKAINEFVHAAAEGDIAAVKEFLKIYGKNLAAIDAKDKVGRTALMRAAHNGQEEMVKFLLDHGASPNVTDGVDRTALHHAAMSGHFNVVKTLLEHGAFYRGVNSGDVTPLKLAQWNQNVPGNDRAQYVAIISLLKNWPKIQKQRQAAEKKQQRLAAEKVAASREKKPAAKVARAFAT
jgi:ankyrin repeat protein